MSTSKKGVGKGEGEGKKKGTQDEAFRASQAILSSYARPSMIRRRQVLKRNRPTWSEGKRKRR